MTALPERERRSDELGKLGAETTRANPKNTRRPDEQRRAHMREEGITADEF